MTWFYIIIDACLVASIVMSLLSIHWSRQATRNWQKAERLWNEAADNWEKAADNWEKLAERNRRLGR